MDFGLGPWLIRPDLNQISRDSRSLRLTPKAMDVLVCLAKREGGVVSKDTLFGEVWPGTSVTDDALTKCIGELRRAFRAPKSEVIIDTIPKRGYRIAVPVMWETPDDSQCEHASKPDGRAEQPVVERPSGHRRLSYGIAVGVAVALAVLIGTDRMGLFRRGQVRSGPNTIRSIAVLPLEDLSGHSEQEYFADGMTEELITELAQIRAWRVISRTSVMRYKATQKKLTEIARDLSVDAVVEGTVLRSGDRIRVTAQLIHAAEDRHLWSGAYEGDLQDVLSVQRTIARAIAGELRVRANSSEPVQHRNRAVVPEAYEAYLKGCYFLHRLQLAPAQTYFLQSTRCDGRFALAHAMLYEADALEAYRQDLPLPARALQALDTARSLEPLLAEVLTDSGDAKFYWEWDWAAGLAEFQRAAEAGPDSVDSIGHYAGALHTLGRWDAALEQYRRALKLDPVSPQLNLLYLTCLADAHRNEEAVRQFQNTIELDPNSRSAYMRAGEVYQRQGRYEDALTAYLKAESLEGGNSEQLKGCKTLPGAEALRCYWSKRLALLQTRGATTRVPPLEFATLYTLVGDSGRAMEMLEAAYKQRAPRLVRLRASAVWDPVRSDPRFQSLIGRMHFPD
jgi:TolB-like protein/DNA-binding winged helix-turn-helix (wHTH) protein